MLEVRVDWHKGTALVRHTAAIAAVDLVQTIERAPGGTRRCYQARPVPQSKHFTGNEQVLKGG